MRICKERKSKIVTAFSLAVFLVASGFTFANIAKAQDSSAPQIIKKDIKSLEDFEKMKQEVQNDQNGSSEEKQKFFSNLEKSMSDNKVVTSLPANDVDCFDFYKFQSVQVTATPSKESYSPGEQVVFKGTIRNDNSYPIFDGNLFVRIGRDNPNFITEGNLAIDEFVALENVTLDKGEQKLITFSWTAPASVAKGTYRADFFFSVGKKFNLGGLPFSNEVVSSSTQFDIGSENSSPVYLTRSDTKVNGEKYNHIGVSPKIPPGDKVTINQPILNTSTSEKKVKVNYSLYWWDSLNEEDKITSSDEEITVAANSSKELTHVISEIKDSVYYLKISSDAGGEKSIVNIRMASEQVHPRLNFPAVNKFPIPKGEQADLFACFHNTSFKDMKGKVTLTLFDKEGNKVEEMEYHDIINVYMLADKKNFTAAKNLNWLRLEATLQDEQGKIIDSYSTIYDCKLLGKGKCLNQDSSQDDLNLALSGNENKTSKKIISLAILVFTVLIVGVVILIKRKKKGEGGDPPKNSSTRFLLLFLVMVSGAFCIFQARESHSQSSSSSSLVTDPSWNRMQTAMSSSSATQVTFPYTLYEPDYQYYGGVIVYDYTYYYSCYSDVYVGGYYYMYITTNNNVRSGDNIGLVFNTNGPPVYWGGGGACTYTGNSYVRYGPAYITDTPYAAWCPNLSSRCGGEVWDTGMGASYTATVLEPTNIQVSSSDSSIVSCSGLNCHALNPGTVTLTANIPSTSGVMWVNGSQGNTFTLPAQQMHWSISVAQASNPPVASLSCVSPVTKGNGSNCTLTGSDSDNANLLYQIDWNNDGVAEDGWQGPSGSHIFTKPGTWNSSGTFTVNAVVWEYDGGIYGQSSGWKSTIVQVVEGPIPGQCKTPPNNQTKCPPYATNPPFSTGSSDLCDATGSVPVVVENSGDWTWNCTGQYGGSDAPDGCHVYKGVAIPPECGTANGKKLCEGLGDLTWCAADNSIIGDPKVDGYDATWQCEGSCTSELPVTCSAKGEKSCGWIETNP